MRSVVDQRSARPEPNGVPQLTIRAILGTWLAATLPMAVGAWVVAPAIAGSLGSQGLLKAIVLALTAGLVWQFVLVVALVAMEQRSLRWQVVRNSLWLRAPKSPKTGRRGGRLWLIVLPFLVVFAAIEFIPTLPHPAERDFALVLESDAGQSFFSGNWVWFAIVFTMLVFNTIFGEELLFRGYLQPRMEGVFGRWAWLANGVLFAFYHLHVFWGIPGILLLDGIALSYPAQRYRSAVIPIIIHSAQTVLVGALLLAVVLK